MKIHIGSRDSSLVCYIYTCIYLFPDRYHVLNFVMLCKFSLAKSEVDVQMELLTY